jgi:hypothetical protein
MKITMSWIRDIKKFTSPSRHVYIHQEKELRDSWKIVFKYDTTGNNSFQRQGWNVLNYNNSYNWNFQMILGNWI